MQGNSKKKPESNRVKDLQQKLYAKKASIKPYQRMGLHRSDEGAGVLDHWKEIGDDGKKEKIDLVEKPKKRRSEMTIFTKILIMSVMFFMFSAGAAYLVFQFGQNEVSFQDVSLSILGPNSVRAGEELVFDVNIVNNNPVDVVLSDLVVEYPAGTITATAESAPLSKDAEPIEQIRSGFTSTQKFKSILFGTEGDKRTINITYQYRVPNSNQIFFKERAYTLQIETSPVVIEAVHARSFENGDDVSIDIDIISNAEKRVRNLLLNVEYPFGFAFSSSSIDFIGDEGTFIIGDIRPGEKQTVTITGQITGQPDQSRTFRYALGVQRPDERDQISSIYTTTESSLTIENSPLTLAININGNGDSLQVVQPGSTIRPTVQYQNNQQQEFIDGILTLTFRDETYDERTVSNLTGFYNSNDNQLRWTRNDYSPLAAISGGDRGRVTFEFDIPAAQSLAGQYVDPELRLTARLDGTNFSPERDDEEVTSEFTKRLKIATKLGIQNDALHSIGPITNNGPIEPVVGETTDYTIHWKLFNTTSESENTVVRTTLPSYVSWRGVTVPENAAITYDERTRVLVWRAGDLAPGAGYDRDAQEVYFGITFEPSLSQVGGLPTLIPEPEVSGFDTYTETNLEAIGERATIGIPKDPDTKPGIRVIE